MEWIVMMKTDLDTFLKFIDNVGGQNITGRLKLKVLIGPSREKYGTKKAQKQRMT